MATGLEGRKATADEYTITAPSLVLILALDTTTRAGSAAVLDGTRVLAVLPGHADRTHGERLPGELSDVLATAGVTLQAIDLLAVARGPGAFTGLRIGLAAMQGLAMTANRPVVGVSALDALAVTAFETLGEPQARVGAWLDAARGEVFAALYDVHHAAGPVPHLRVAAAVTVASPADTWAAWLAEGPPPVCVSGDGALRYATVLGDVRPLEPPPLAPAIARLALAAATAGGTFLPHQLEPLYIRRPDAEKKAP